MLNRIRFYKLAKELDGYRKGIDEVIKTYKEDKECIDRSRENYSEDYYQCQISAIVNSTKEKMNKLRLKTSIKTEEILGQIKNDLESWIAAPADDKLIQRLQMIKLCNLQLNEAEAASLIKQVKGNYQASYFLDKIIHPEQENNAFNVIQYYAGKSSLEEIYKNSNNIKYVANYFSAPDCEKMQREYNNISTVTRMILSGYCGSDALMDLLPDKIIAGVNFGRPASYEAAAAERYKLDDLTAVGERWAKNMLKDGEALSSIEIDDFKSLDLMDTTKLTGYNKTVAESVNKSRVKEIVRQMPGIDKMIEKSIYAEYLTAQ